MAGHAFFFDAVVPFGEHSVDSAALGPNPSTKYGQAEVNKIVKLAANDNYVLVSDGDDIEGVIRAIDASTVNNGYSFGSVQRKFDGGLRAVVSGSTLTVGATVVAGPQAAIGTAQKLPVVKAGAGSVFKFRVKSLQGGSGAAGTQVLIEPLTR